MRELFEYWLLRFAGGGPSFLPSIIIMRHFTKLLSGLGFVLLGALLLAASAVAQEAKILKKVGAGTFTITRADGSQITAVEGAMVPLNATIATGPNVELYVEAVTGAITTIKADSSALVDTITANSAILDLKKGSVVSQIDK